MYYSGIPYTFGQSSSDIQIGRGIYSKFKEIAEKEGRGISEIMRESLTDWLQNKKHVSTADFITFIKEQKNVGKSWSEISSLILERYGISFDKEQLKSLSR
jgi:ATP-dependent DNA ligase